ncbi:MAG: deoxynucleoside kinase [Gammaproteobacteria bacterium]|nr:MAG: deoxynucleoside kinase [Gammaproteobacteria bacterium]
MAASDFNYIVVEGPIGVGKTTLARRLAESFAAELLLEEPQENPFLARFYENPRAHALSTQLYFLLQRARQIHGLRQSDMFSRVRVADYLMDKDQLFAELNLEPDELTLYQQVYSQLVGETLQPDLVIYLQAPVSVLQDRIASRGIAYEQAIDAQYLQRLVSAYTRFFYHYEASPLVIINAASIDFANSDGDYQLLFDKLRHVGKGRHFLNPLPF